MLVVVRDPEPRERPDVIGQFFRIAETSVELLDLLDREHAPTLTSSAMARLGQAPGGAAGPRPVDQARSAYWAKASDGDHRL